MTRATLIALALVLVVLACGRDAPDPVPISGEGWGWDEPVYRTQLLDIDEATEFDFIPPEPLYFVKFVDGEGLVVAIRSDGEVVFGDDVTPSEASREFYRALADTLVLACAQPEVD